MSLGRPVPECLPDHIHSCHPGYPISSLCVGLLCFLDPWWQFVLSLPCLHGTHPILQWLSKKVGMEINLGDLPHLKFLYSILILSGDSSPKLRELLQEYYKTLLYSLPQFTSQLSFCHLLYHICSLRSFTHTFLFLESLKNSLESQFWMLLWPIVEF